MMPDAALVATEQQFIRLVGSCNQIAQFYVYPFSLPQLDRGQKAREHIASFYFEFEDLATQGLDALIITGANGGFLWMRGGQRILSSDPGIG